MAYERMFRTIVLGGSTLASGLGLAVICDSCGSGETAGPICATSVSLSSPCGMKSVTSTCAGTVSCDHTPSANDTAPTGCTIGPITGNCSVHVVLGDGTAQDVPVSFGQGQGRQACGINVVTAPVDGFLDFTSATCVRPTPDAGTDADAANAADVTADGSDDATGDAGNAD